MAKRFTDTDKWKREWFCDLSPNAKLVWFYILDQCDHRGVWFQNFSLLSAQVGFKVTKNEFESWFGSKVKSFDGDKYFIPSFVEFQYGQLKESNNSHIGILNLLKKYAFLSPSMSPSQGAQDKDKDKDKELVFEFKGGMGGNENSDEPKEKPVSAALRQELHFNPVRARIVEILQELQIYSPKVNRHMAEIVRGYDTIENFNTWLANTKSSKKFKELLRKAANGDGPDARAHFANYFLAALLEEAGLRSKPVMKNQEMGKDAQL